MTNFSGLIRIVRRCSSHQCDAARAADHDEKKVKIWINFQVSKTKKTAQKSGNLQEREPKRFKDLQDQKNF